MSSNDLTIPPRPALTLRQPLLTATEAAHLLPSNAAGSTMPSAPERYPACASVDTSASRRRCSKPGSTTAAPDPERDSQQHAHTLVADAALGSVRWERSA